VCSHQLLNRLVLPWLLLCCLLVRRLATGPHRLEQVQRILWLKARAEAEAEAETVVVLIALTIANLHLVQAANNWIGSFADMRSSWYITGIQMRQLRQLLGSMILNLALRLLLMLMLLLLNVCLPREFPGISPRQGSVHRTQVLPVLDMQIWILQGLGTPISRFVKDRDSLLQVPFSICAVPLSRHQ